MRRRLLIAGVAALVIIVAAGIVVVRDGGAGPGWSAPVTLSPDALVGGVQSATSADGTTTAVWAERRGATWALMSSDRPADGAWSAPTAIVEPQPWRFHSLSLGVNPRGDAVVAFAFSSRSRAVLLASFRPEAGRWEEAQAIAPVIGGFYLATAAVGQRGDAAVAWTAPFGPRWIVSVSRHTPTGWGDPTEVLDAGAVEGIPTLVVGPTGEAVVAAVTNRGRPAKPRLRLAVARSAGAVAPWSRMPMPDSSVAGSAQPTLALDGRARPNLVWSRPAVGSAVLVISRADRGVWGAPSELDRGPRYGFGSVVAQPRGRGVVVAWLRWATPSRQVTVRAALVGADGTPTPATALDTFTLPGTGAGRYLGPPSGDLALSGGESPTLLWPRQVARDPVPASDVVFASADESGRWSRANVVTRRPLLAWPVSVGSVGATRIASWATLTNPNGGPIDVAVSQWGP